MGLLKKIKRTVRKAVPKELSGIMRAAAPFVAPYSLPAAAALTIGGQLRSGRGRISPLETVLALAPSDMARGLTKKVPGGEALDKFLYGTPMKLGESRIVPGEGFTDVAVFPETQGILGVGGKFGLKEFVGGKLLSPMKDGVPTLSKARVAGLVAAGASLATTQEEIKEEGDQLGLPDAEIARLQAEAAEVWQDFDTTAFRPKITAAIGGLMRKNLREGSKGEGDELPPDPTTPVNPFKPKPIGPVLPDKMMASDEISIGQIEMLIERGADNDLIKEITGAADGVINQIRDAMRRRDSAAGGLMRTNFALGTRPTKQESGLGGLPIEADMRYSGGFMPYGKKEKADDVPARLSKNEFVFTADAVRAAGGGNINTGARRMYNTMKQLESMGRA
jgi:hypothetical protein